MFKALIALLSCAIPGLCLGQAANFACKLVAQGKGFQLFSGYAKRHVENGGEILVGHVDTPASRSFGGPCAGVPWAAALAPDGKQLWAATVQEQPEACSSWYGLTTDGEHLWSVAVRDNGLVQLGTFKADTLEREASVQTGFQVTETAGARTVPGFQFHSETGGDLQVSVHQTFPESVKVAVFSRDLRTLLDNIYSIPDRLAGKESEPLSGMKLIRLPDRTGYYMVVEPKLARGGKRGPRIGIIRLDNNGAIRWAKAYTTGYSDSDITPRVAKDGAILVSVASHSASEPARSLLIKINPNGAVNWATTVEDIEVSFDDFQFPCQSEPTPYRFTEPSLLAVGIQQDDTDQPSWAMKTYSVLFRLNYETGKIEKQTKFGANTPGSCTFVEHDTNSFYVGLGYQQWLDKPTGHGSRPNRVKYHDAALRFDYDFNLLAARKVHDAGGFGVARPLLHLLGPDNVVISCDGYEGKLIVEATNANLESSNACRWLDKDSFTFTKSNFQQRQANAANSPLTVTVSEAKSKISQADLSLAPLDLKAIPCGKNVGVTQPAENEQSFNTNEGSSESIAEAFVQAYSGADVDAIGGLYADRVGHTDSGVISNAAIMKQAKEYFARWPVRQWSLVGPVKAASLGPSRQKITFSASYDASDPQTNKHASGIAKETLILAPDSSGAMKIVSQKEQLTKRNGSHSD